MGSTISKYGSNGMTNLSKELNIDVNLIKSCQYMLLNDDRQYIFSEIDVNFIKNAINSMNHCNYIETNYIYNTKNRIYLKFEDNKEFILAMSDCGTYIGVPTRATAMGIWFYLIDNYDIRGNPFEDLIKLK